MIKFSGLHLHMVLVLAVICVVAYVFYISKDIVALDREIKMLHGKVEQLASRLQSAPQQQPRPQQGAAAQAPPGALQQQQAKMMAQARAAGLPAKTGVATPAPAVYPAKTQMAARHPSAAQHQHAAPLPKVFQIDDDTEDETEDETEEETEQTEQSEEELTETGSDTAERVKEILSNVEASAEAEVDAAPVKIKEPTVEVEDSAPAADAIQKLSWNEIKDKCRELGIPIKGSNKEQLLAKLVEALKS